jgi:hypothetical protein
VSTDATKKIIPGHGTVFIAPANTALPSTPLTAFTLTGAPPASWENLGHTSKDNLPAFTRDGGDKTVLDSWLEDSIGTVYASTAWSLGINPIQVDKNALDLGFGGNFDVDGGYIVPGSTSGTAKALVLLMTDGTGTMLFYIPNTNVSLADAPSLDSTKYMEISLSASILAAAPGVIPAAASGVSAIMKIFKTGLVGVVPTIATALPGSMGAGSWIELIGTGFTGVTLPASVTVGGVVASAIATTATPDTNLMVKLPAGSAGSAPVIVTNAAGASAPKAYTRIV